MNIITLNKENITAYQSMLIPDVADNIGRADWYGIAEEQGRGTLVFRCNSVKGKGEMFFFTASDAKTADALLTEYEDRLCNAGITGSELELPLTLGSIEQEALDRKGYRLSTGESRILRTTVAYLAALPVAARGELPQTIGSTGALSIRQFQQAIRKKQKADISEEVQIHSPAWFDQVLSCYVQIKGKICGCLLIHRMPSGAYHPELFRITEPASTNDLLNMIRYVIFRAQEQLSGDTPIVISRLSERTRALTDKLLPGLQGDTILAAVKEISKKGND